MKLDKSFYTRESVVHIAQDLLGKYLITSFDGVLSGGIIIETEAYEGVTDRASHAFGGRRTGRTEVMFGEGGIAYVYLCYGIHSLFNIVTNKQDIPHAVLIRGIIPVPCQGLLQPGGREEVIPGVYCSGPGKVSKLLGIHYSHTGTDLTGNEIWLEDRGLEVTGEIMAGPRIGVEYAGEDALLPYRFRITADQISQ
jgi:DNA-3-methyladenine glycosylase